MFERSGAWWSTARTRALTRHKGFAAAILAIASMSVCASTVVVSAVDAALLTPLYARGQNSLVVAGARPSHFDKRERVRVYSM
ncbi:MAG: hypothetical protein ACRD1V_13795 [Vicinamibacterales bacterium]